MKKVCSLFVIVINVKKELISDKHFSEETPSVILLTLSKHRAELSILFMELFVPVRQRVKNPFELSKGKHGVVHKGPYNWAHSGKCTRR